MRVGKLLIIIALSSTSLFADILVKEQVPSEDILGLTQTELKNVLYTSCESCFFDWEYIRKAMKHPYILEMEVGKQLDLIVVSYESTGDYSQRYANYDFRTIAITKELDAVSQVSIKGTLIPNSSYHKEKFSFFVNQNPLDELMFVHRDPYTGILLGYGGAYSHNISTMNLGYIDQDWSNTDDIGELLKSEVQQRLDDSIINPFNFSFSPLSVFLQNRNNESVMLVSKSVAENSDWSVGYIKLSNGNYYPAPFVDENQATRLVDSSIVSVDMSCFAHEKESIEFCRALNENNEFFGPIVRRYVIEYPPYPKPPSGCDPNKQICPPS